MVFTAAPIDNLNLLTVHSLQKHREANGVSLLLIFDPKHFQFFDQEYSLILRAQVIQTHCKANDKISAKDAYEVLMEDQVHQVH